MRHASKERKHFARFPEKAQKQQISCIRKSQPSGETLARVRPLPSRFFPPAIKFLRARPGSSIHLFHEPVISTAFISLSLVRASINLEVSYVSVRTLVKRLTNGRPWETCSCKNIFPMSPQLSRKCSTLVARLCNKWNARKEKSCRDSVSRF